MRFSCHDMAAILSAVLFQALVPHTAAVAGSPVPLMTGVHAQELAAEGGGSVRAQTDERYSFLERWRDEGHWIDWNMEVPADGEYSLAFIYSIREDPVRLSLFIDGELKIEELKLAGPARRWRYEATDRALHLSEGVRTFRFVNDGNWLDLAWIYLLSPDEASNAASKAITALREDPESPARRQAITVLKEYPEEVDQNAASALLAVILDDGEKDAVRTDAVELLQACAPEVIASVVDEDAIAVLMRIAGEGSGDLRLAACGILESMGRDLPGRVRDWPMWRNDAERSGKTHIVLPEDLHLQWVREMPAPRRAWRHQWDDAGKLEFDLSYAPVTMGRLIFMPSSATDSVTAYSMDDGSEQWRFYTDGPVRLAPAAWDGKVYFTSDDGRLYCVNAETGELAWKFRGGPSDHRLLGNERIINFWAARGGPVVTQGEVYFAAGLWPLHGVFVYALDAKTGGVIWVNDTTSSDYVALPHGGAYGYGGLAPQGYIAVDGDELVVSAGRGPNPVRFDRRTGGVIHSDYRGWKGSGSYAVHSGGMGFMRNDMLEKRVEALAGLIDGEVFYNLAAQDKLFVTTENGTLYCFGPEKTDPVIHEYRPAAIEPRESDWSHAARELLAELGETEGYALMLGAGSGDLLRELLIRSDLHIVVAESDPGKVRGLRDELVESGMYGRRAAVVEAAPASFSVQPYLFSLVASEDAETAGIFAGVSKLEPVLERLRPYGGVAWLGFPPEASPEVSKAVSDADVDGVSADIRKGRVFVKRGGPLTGAGEWTHQYCDAANTLLSHEERVRLPLGILWFGGPTHDNILPRHAGGPRPQVAGGRQVFLGVETISARCVYTGRELWERSFPGIGHPFTNLALEDKWSEGQSVYMSNIPGATYIGSPFVTLSDAVYLRHDGVIYRLDPATGETTDSFMVPGRSTAQLYGEAAPEWGHISVRGDFLVTTAEPHIFENQDLGWSGSYSGTSSRRLAVMNRHDGRVLWEREAETAFRHMAIVSSETAVYVIDGISDSAIRHLQRRGKTPSEISAILALDIATGSTLWREDSEVFGTYLVYSSEHDILVEGGSFDMRVALGDEPRWMAARCGSGGGVLWRGEHFTLPGVPWGEILIPGRPGAALSLLTGAPVTRDGSEADGDSGMRYTRAYGCNTLNAGAGMLLFRTGYAGFFDLEHGSGTGTFGGFRSGCTANMIPADGVLSALDYSRTCTCSYAHQTSLAMVHMPDDTNIEFWTRYAADPPDPEGHGINFGAPGRRVDVAGSGLVWYDRPGSRRRHPSAILDNGGGLDWVAASAAEFAENETIMIETLHEGEYNVRLHFTELDVSAEPGRRVFNVYINGERVLEDFDVAAEAGGPLRGVVEEFPAASEGTLQIEMKKSDAAGRPPIISGIEVVMARRAARGE